MMGTHSIKHPTTTVQWTPPHTPGSAPTDSPILEFLFLLFVLFIYLFVCLWGKRTGQFYPAAGPFPIREGTAGVQCIDVVTQTFFHDMLYDLNVS